MTELHPSVKSLYQQIINIRDDIDFALGSAQQDLKGLLVKVERLTRLGIETADIKDMIEYSQGVLKKVEFEVNEFGPSENEADWT